MSDSKVHWENLYKTKSSKEVSWYQPRLEKSLELILGLGLSKGAAIIDVGGGASTLPDDLLGNGFKHITVLDISSEALKVSKNGVGDKASLIQWIEADVTQASLEPEYYDLWHDRAVFHFLTKLEDRQRYIANLGRAVKPGGAVIMATFGPNGPLKCSGLEIVRYSAQSLSAELDGQFLLLKDLLEVHKTPSGSEQQFIYCLLKMQ